MISQTRTVSLRRKTKFRTLFAGLIGRVIRRGFFRIVLLGFLLLVAVLLALNFLASSDNANKLLDRAAADILDPNAAEITWDRDQTKITGPGVFLAGEIRIFNLRVRRQGGKTPHEKRREALSYDLLYIPELVVFYDIKRLPDFVSRVEFPKGLVLHFNTYANEWLDEDLFKGGGGGGALSLPEIVVQGDAEVNLRADGILVPPEDLPVVEGEPLDWYRFKLSELGLQFSGNTDEYALRGKADARGRLGAQFELGGTVRRDASKINIQFHSSAPLLVDEKFLSILSAEVRQTADQFQVKASASINGAINVESEKVDFRARIDATEGSLCFSGFPVKVSDVRADIRIENSGLRVVAEGVRGGARVAVTATVDDIGGRNEVLKVRVTVRDLLVDEEFRKALLPARLQPENARDWLTLEPWPAELFDPNDPEMAPVKGYPDWPGIRGLAEPNVDPVLHFVCRGFTPMGLCNFELDLDSEVKGIMPDGSRTLDQWLRWKVFVRNASACYTAEPENAETGFPVPLHECYGVVAAETRTGIPGRFVVRGYTEEELADLGNAEDVSRISPDKRGLFGRLAGGGSVWINAVYDENYASLDKPRLTLMLSSDGVSFNETIAQRLPAGVQDAVNPFMPRGRVDIQGATVIVYPQSPDSLSFEFALRANGVAAIFKFDDAQRAMQFSDVAGTLRINSKGNEVLLENISGKLLGSDVTMALDYRAGAIHSLSVKSEAFELSNELRDALPQGVATVLEQFVLGGQVRVDIFTRRGTEKPDLVEAEVVFAVGRKGRLEFKKIPYALTDVTGRVFVSMTGGYVNVFLHDFGGIGGQDPGRAAPGRIKISGRVTAPVTDATAAVPEGASPPAPQPVYDLQITADDLPVDEKLLAGMTPMLRKTPDEVTPALVQFIRDLHLTGAIGASGRVVSDAAGNWNWRVEVFLRNTGVKFEKFKYQFANLNGTVVIDGTDVSLRNVTGIAENGQEKKATFTLHQAGYTDADGWSVSVSARKMSFHHSTELADALPDGLREPFLKMSPRGEFDIDFSCRGKDEFMSFDVSLDVIQTDLDLGLHFDDMTARFDYQGVRDGEESRGNGHVYISEVYFKKARFNDVTSNLQFFAGRIEFPNLRGRFYGGWVEGRFGMSESASGTSDYSGELVVRRANLGELGATAFGTKDLVGVLDSEISFHSHIDSEGQIGKGRIDIGAINRNSEDPDPDVRAQERECKLASVPLFDAIFKVVGGEQNFDEAHVFFWLSPNRITIREMDVVSDAARVEIFGGDDENYIEYDTAEMRMKLFFTLAPRSPIPLPVIQWVLDALKQILFPLYVTGKLGAPRVDPLVLTAEELQGITDQFPRRPRGP